MKSLSLLNRLILIFFCLTVVIGCSNRPNGVLSKSEMVDLLVDLQKLEAYWSMTDGYGTVSNDSVRKVYRQEILKRHGLNEMQFEYSLKWYAHNIDDYVEVYKDVEQCLQEELKIASEESRTVATTGNMYVADSDNIWNGLPIYALHNGLGKNDIRFEIKSPSGLKRGDLLRWQMKTTNRKSDVILLFGVDYNNGTTSYSLKQISSNDPENLYITFQTDSTLDVKRMYGLLQYKLKQGEILLVDSISISKHPLTRETYHQLNTQYKYRMGGDIIRRPNKHETQIIKSRGRDSIKQEKNNVVSAKETVIKKPSMFAK